MTIAVNRKPNNSIIMDGSVPSSSLSINSRSTAIKTILLAAWRAKLTNDEWENRIRKVLPRGVNGDVYDLADCLLKQALIGPVPNQLFMSYLKHAVHSGLVSHSAVLRSIANQAINLRSSSLLLYRTSSIVCLLEFLKLFRDKISCNGTELECLNLCHSIGDLIHWLLRCVSQIIDHLTNAQQSHASQLNYNNNISTHSVPPSSASMPGSSPIITLNSQQNLSSVSNSASSSANSIGTSAPSGTSHNDAALSIIDLCTETIHYFIDKSFTKSLLFMSKIEHPKEFDDSILKTVQSIEQKLINCPQLQFIQDRVKHFDILSQLSHTFNSKELHPSTVAAQQLRYLQTHKIRSTQITSSSNFEKKVKQYSVIPAHDSTTNHALFNSLYPLVAFDAILRPARLNKYLARQIAIITTFNTAPVYMTYCELIRVCLIGLIDAHGNSKPKASWSFFTFLKLPRLLIELNRIFVQQNSTSAAKSGNEPNQAANFINDLKQAFERLCEYSPLLDEAEYKCNCDLFKCLVKELIKNDPALMQLRNLDFKKFPARRPINLNSNNPSGGHMMLKTEPFVTTMLETLNCEQDPTELFSILSQSCSGISFEYTLSAAAATGRFHIFVTRLVEHNELYKLPQDNSSSTNNHSQALIFDITFLILIYIAQRYGPKLIDKERNATFNKWYHECYNEELCFSCPREMLKKCDPEIVTSLIKQLVSRNHDIQLRSVNWHDVCFNLPKAIDEILNSWTQGVLDDDDIALVIERLRSKMCFMAVVAATWLQYHIRTLDDADRAKPLHLLSNLTKTVQHIKQDPAVATSLKNEGYPERSSLMGAIIKRIYFELVPSKVGSSSSKSLSKGGRTSWPTTGGSTVTDPEESQGSAAYNSYRDKFISTLTTHDIFVAHIKKCLSRGWIDYNSLNSLSSLFKIIGSECFTNLMVEQILSSHESPSDLARAVNITFGLFHLDIEACAFALIKSTIPSWLMGEKKRVALNQPRAFALANLAVMTIIEVYKNLKGSPNQQESEGVFKNANSFESKSLAPNGIVKQEPCVLSQSKNLERIIDNIEASNNNSNGSKDIKRIKLMQEQRRSLNGELDEEEDSSRNKAERLDRLNCHISDLMRLFREIMSDPVMSHRTLFPVLFLQQTVVCAREEASLITVHLQPEILLDIIDLFSSEMTFELVLAISNLSSTNSRKYTAKAICKLAQIKESKQKSSFFADGETEPSHLDPSLSQLNYNTAQAAHDSSSSLTNPRMSSSSGAASANIGTNNGRSGAGGGGGGSVPMVIG